MRFDVLTIFPRIFDSFLKESLLNKAIHRDLLQVHVHDIRDWTTDKHHKVDDRPFGGGPGMVMSVAPVVNSVYAVQMLAHDPGHLILLTPQGRRLNQQIVEELATNTRLVMLCGRYEGFDQRVIDILQPDELSIGDYVLNGGEVAAMVLIESVMRLIPGVLGDETSSKSDSFSFGQRYLEFPQYTRPRDFEGHSAPEILFSGDHQAIDRWRKEQSYLRTRQRRGDLLPESKKVTKPINTEHQNQNNKDQDYES